MAVSSSTWSQSEITSLVQGTQVQAVPAVVVSAVSPLLDSEGLAVREITSDGFGGRVVHVVTADLAASACPSCGGVLHLVQGPCDDPAAGHLVRDSAAALGVAQAAVAVRG